MSPTTTGFAAKEPRKRSAPQWHTPRGSYAHVLQRGLERRPQVSHASQPRRIPQDELQFLQIGASNPDNVQRSNPRSLPQGQCWQPPFASLAQMGQRGRGDSMLQKADQPSSESPFQSLLESSLQHGSAMSYAEAARRGARQQGMPNSGSIARRAQPRRVVSTAGRASVANLSRDSSPIAWERAHRDLMRISAANSAAQPELPQALERSNPPQTTTATAARTTTSSPTRQNQPLNQARVSRILRCCDDLDARVLLWRSVAFQGSIVQTDSRD